MMGPPTTNSKGKGRGKKKPFSKQSTPQELCRKNIQKINI
jgi:hypothetical protein